MLKSTLLCFHLYEVGSVLYTKVNLNLSFRGESEALSGLYKESTGRVQMSDVPFLLQTKREYSIFCRSISWYYK